MAVGAAGGSSWVVRSLAIACGICFVLFAGLYAVLWCYVSSQKQSRRESRKVARASKTADSSAAAASGDSRGEDGGGEHHQSRGAAIEQADEPEQTLRRRGPGHIESPAGSPTARGPPSRTKEVLAKEQEIKRDALNIFRRLQATQDMPEKLELVHSATKLFDAIPERVGVGSSHTMSGKIVFCNALMEAGGLDELQLCRDSKDARAADLIERVVPIIFTS